MKLLENRETKFSKKVRNILISFVLIFIWVQVMYNLIEKIKDLQIFIYEPPSIWYKFFTACILAPLWEELVFRVAPITIAKNAGKQYILPTIIISSCIFGMGHPDSPHPILFQGVMGFIFSLLYIKNNYSYWSVVTLHFMWNFYIFLFYTL